MGVWAFLLQKFSENVTSPVNGLDWDTWRKSSSPEATSMLTPGLGMATLTLQCYLERKRYQLWADIIISLVTFLLCWHLIFWGCLCAYSYSVIIHYNYLSFCNWITSSLKARASRCPQQLVQSLAMQGSQ
jgi:hypothetical protein